MNMGKEDIKKYETLLAEFQNVPIQKRNRTFMDICQYPRSRFEEICSRVLAYYFNPDEDHGFRDLWLRAFVRSCHNRSNEYNLPREVEEIILEDPTINDKDTKNNRIDVVVVTNDTIYVIENKIEADLDNDLTTYAQHIEKTPQYKEKRKVYVVLTAHTLQSDEKRNAKNAGFKEVSYKTLFGNVMTMLDEYKTSDNNSQLTFMLDFMNTVNNKMNFMIDKERAKFFTKNRSLVDRLLEEYKQWKQEQKDEVKKIRDRIAEKTNDDTWRQYNWWDLIIEFQKGTSNQIGIEASFTEKDGDPFAVFCIYITTWHVNKKFTSQKCWKPYKEAVTKKYKGYEGYDLDEGDNNDNHRVYVHIAEIDGNDTDKILSNLQECYDFLKGLVNEREKNGLINK